MLKLLIFFGLLLDSFAKPDPCERKKRDASPDPDSNVIDFPDCTEFNGESNVAFCSGSIETAPSITKEGRKKEKIR